jgi:hypothetical protein
VTEPFDSARTESPSRGKADHSGAALLQCSISAPPLEPQPVRDPAFRSRAIALGRCIRAHGNPRIAETSAPQCGPFVTRDSPNPQCSDAPGTAARAGVFYPAIVSGIQVRCDRSDVRIRRGLAVGRRLLFWSVWRGCWSGAPGIDRVECSGGGVTPGGDGQDVGFGVRGSLKL